jgi:pilus assembly protein CpaF
MSLLDRVRGQGEEGAAPGAATAAGLPRTPRGNLRQRVQARLLEEINTEEEGDRDAIVARITDIMNAVIGEQNLMMTKADRQKFLDDMINDFLGLGPIESLIKDPDINEVMVNGPNQIYVEQRGKIHLTDVKFESEEQLRKVIERIVSTIGRRVDESSPMVDARLKDGSRVNVIIPPLSMVGPTITIRKFSKKPYTVQNLIEFGTMTDSMAGFLRSCVRARLNILVSGGTGSGKTTTLNVLSSFIPEEERIVTVEDAAELQLNQDHVVTLESRPSTVEGRGRIAIRDLVVNCLRMRPDRIVVGECRGGEALDMLQAMNTGHDGSLTTIHANSPRDSLNRLETLVLMAGVELPSRAIRDQISSAINVIIQQSRLRDGKRKITSIAEVLGMQGDQIKVQDIFIFKQTGVDKEGKVLGHFTPTGIIPKYFKHLQAFGEGVPDSMFAPTAEPAREGGT